MATTTAKLIREKQSTLISALSPDDLRGVSFREYDRSEPFAEWADANPRACMRKFYIEDLSTYEGALVSDGLSEQVQTEFLIQVAYPKDSRYGISNRSDAMDLIEGDRLAIDNTVGLLGSANYVSGQNTARSASKEVEDLESVWLLTFTLDVIFWRDTSTAGITELTTESGATLITE